MRSPLTFLLGVLLWASATFGIAAGFTTMPTPWQLACLVVGGLSASAAGLLGNKNQPDRLEKTRPHARGGKQSDVFAGDAGGRESPKDAGVRAGWLP